MKLLILIALELPLLCWYLWHIGVLGWLTDKCYHAGRLYMPTMGIVFLGTGSSLLGTVITIVVIGQKVQGFDYIVVYAVGLIICGAIIDSKTRRMQ
ncbi:hypothetical protein FACS1894103_1270 [Campylobacterota bacterium]|nr:hypothetical protein FACS1894103_1270 [Campylobacterota bacterium]